MSINATTYFVNVNGSDSNSGTSENDAFKSISTAVSNVQPGDTVLVGGGIYYYSSTISISKSGTASDTCCLMSSPGEKPVLDFSGQSFGKRAIKLNGSYWHIKGLDVRYAGDNGLNISGGNNVIEQCNFYENKDTGVQLGNGAHDNTIINCDSYYNADPSDYGDADGFAAKLDVGTNNKFVGCRAWQNCDDGWDGYMRGSDNVTTILENCWTWGNGYMKDWTDPGSKANGNGFKMGGGDNSNSAQLKHHFKLTNCMAFNNKAKGFDQNNNAGSMELLNCTGYGNLTANYRIKKDLADGETLTVKNCVSLNGKVELGDFAIVATNSWDSPFLTTEDDFVSIDTTGISAARKSDGSLPDVSFMNLNKGSDLIDAGTDVGLEYKGSAPDLGAFESDFSTAAKDIVTANNIKMWFNNDILCVNYNNTLNAKMQLNIYALTGQLFLSKALSENENTINCAGLKKGIYIAELLKNNKQATVLKLNKSY